MPELYIDSVAHKYGKNQVINNVYLKCEIGEIVGLLGRNGCGKSTLLKIIFGSIEPQYKHLKVNGVLIDRGYKTGHVSYLPQGNFIPGKMKLKTLLKLYINKFESDILQVDLIKENLDVSIRDLSGGQARLVESLLIIYGDSEFVLLDEPFSQLAPLIADELKMHIRQLSVVKGFIITDHHFKQILEVSSRIVLLHNGGNYNIKTTDDLKLHGYLPGEKR
ncbi:MAG TPA: ATP-binding cassette domain-containing protein [Pedobacter sp.]|jgi:ABC-type multidrug transport system ATPase subunit